MKQRTADWLNDVAFKIIRSFFIVCGVIGVATGFIFAAFVVVLVWTMFASMVCWGMNPGHFGPDGTKWLLEHCG